MQSDSAAFGREGKPLKYSLGRYTPDPDEIEKVTVPPSTELIPDEYFHEDNKMGLVVIFYSAPDVGNMQIFKEALTEKGYDVLEDNIYKISSKEFVMETLKRIAEGDHTDKTSLILAFMGNAEEEDYFAPDDEENEKPNWISVREIWKCFTSNNCPTLKYKPKIFVFQASKKPDFVHFDCFRSLIEEHPENAYDIPAEADMLLVYNKTELPSNRNNFIQQLSYNIYYDGHKDDIVGLVTHTDHHYEKRPLIISTLTRKFYVTPSNPRGHYYDVNLSHQETIEMLQDLNVKIDAIQEQHNIFKRKLEQIAGRKSQSSISANVQSNNSATVSKAKPKASSSSVDSKPKLTKAAEKPKWVNPKYP